MFATIFLFFDNLYIFCVIPSCVKLFKRWGKSSTNVLEYVLYLVLKFFMKFKGGIYIHNLVLIAKI